MKRLHQPGKRNPDPSGEPNFYRIAEHYPLPPDPILVPDHNDVVAASSHDEPIFIHKNADAFHSEKKSAQYVTSPVDSPRKRSLEPKQRLCETSGAQHSESKPTKYIISAQGLQPVNDDNATGALDERKLPAISNRFTTESSPFIDNSNSRERTYSLSEMYELLTDNGSNKFSADGVKQVEDNDVKEVQFDERKLSAAGSDTIGSTSRRDN